MKLYHYLKDWKKPPHEIPLKSPEFFVDKEIFHGKVTDLGWIIEVESLHESKYNGHKFEILIEPEEIDRMYEILGKMKKHFESHEAVEEVL